MTHQQMNELRVGDSVRSSDEKLDHLVVGNYGNRVAVALILEVTALGDWSNALENLNPLSFENLVPGDRVRRVGQDKIFIVAKVFKDHAIVAEATEITAENSDNWTVTMKSLPAI
ncbi:MAG: hypothetical protein UY96_C0008G0002 [Parcubacteria group bacterium GW2011_GWB1_56_8]|nr:MAG: hypothetical protein UY96_C0008G0002 [Parcubacteria group bacterium GW2011_GWB1_56_8]